MDKVTDPEGICGELRVMRVMILQGEGGRSIDNSEYEDSLVIRLYD